MRLALFAAFAMSAWSQATISVSPTTVVAGGPVTITITNAPNFVDNWYSPYPGTGPTLGGWDAARWGWLDGTQTTNPPASPITNAIINAAAPTTPGPYVYVLQGGNGTTGPYRPIPPYAAVTVTSGTGIPPPPITFTAGSGSTAATCSLTPPLSGFIKISCTGCSGATRQGQYPAPIPAPGTDDWFLLCGNTVAFQFKPSISQPGKTDWQAGINGNSPPQTGTF